MNQQRFESMYRGMTAQAKKVYDCIPISDPWTPSQIMQELHRKNISMSDMRVVLGCVNSLIDCGVVIEVSKGLFKREVIRPKCEPKQQVIEIIETTKEEEVKQPAPVPVKPTPAISPISLLGSLSSRLRAFADEMDGVAMVLAEKSEKEEAETSKMRQLQALLKSLG